MGASVYTLGVTFAIISGIINNLGTVLQKKVVNDKSDEDSKLMKKLIKSPLWLIGLLMQLVIGSVFFMLAQLYIGPALISGFMAAGLIVLVIGSVYIVGESLKKVEIIGILLMILGITFLGFSELSIDIVNTNLMDLAFVANVVVFTVVFSLIAIICEIIAKKDKRLFGILLAISSGCMFALSNFWISPLMSVFAKVFEETASWGELIWFISAAIILPLVNIIGIARIQTAFTEGQASNLIPIQQVPIQISPIIVYFFVFLLAAPSIISTIYMLVGIILIILSSFSLGRRQTQMDEIK
jgi:drug/metabolite transporter (DMT)-like permease